MSEIGRRSLEDLGLSPYEARVLFALLRSGASNSSQLARVADVPRTSTYAVLESLAGLGLAHRQPGDGPAVWTAPHPDEVLERLAMAKQDTNDQELRQYRLRVAEARRLLAETFLPAPSVTLPYVHIIRGAGQEAKAFDQLVTDAAREVLIFDCAVLAADQAASSRVVVAAVDRGLSVRVLCDAAGAGLPAATPVLVAGLEARLAHSLPIAMTVVDGRAAMIGMWGPTEAERPDAVLPTTLLVENAEMAGALVLAFHHYWAQSRPAVVAT